MAENENTTVKTGQVEKLRESLDGLINIRPEKSQPADGQKGSSAKGDNKDK